MSDAYFEDHPTDPEKVILRKRPCPFCQDKPRTWQGLTKKEIQDYVYQPVEKDLISFAYFIEAKLKEKNT